MSEQEKHLMWDRLQRSVNAIHHTQPINISLEDLYKDVENLCLNGSSQVNTTDTHTTTQYTQALHKHYTSTHTDTHL